jgi:hypothetical protein
LSKNHVHEWTMTKFELDLRIPMIYQQMQFQTLYIHYYKSYRAKTEKFLIFCKFKRDYSVKIHQSMTRFEQTCNISTMYQHMQFQPYT